MCSVAFRFTFTRPFSQRFWLARPLKYLGLLKQDFLQARCPTYHPTNSVRAPSGNETDTFLSVYTMLLSQWVTHSHESFCVEGLILNTVATSICCSFCPSFFCSVLMYNYVYTSSLVFPLTSMCTKLSCCRAVYQYCLD